MLYPVGQLI